jgi:hypothetical protein
MGELKAGLLEVGGCYGDREAQCAIFTVGGIFLASRAVAPHLW